MKHGKTFAVGALVAALVGVGGTAVAEHGPDTRAGQFCGQNEHGLVIQVSGADGTESLSCREVDGTWRWSVVSVRRSHTSSSATATRAAGGPKSGRLCSSAEHGTIVTATYADGTAHRLVCARDGAVWRWRGLTEAEERARANAREARAEAQRKAEEAKAAKERDGEVVTASPGLTG